MQLQLREEYQPVGVLEEIEVERIALCHWRLTRTWRYENAEIRLGQEQISQEAIKDFCTNSGQHWTVMNRCLMSTIASAKREIESTGEVSQELRKQVSVFFGVYEMEAEKKARAQPEEIAEQIAQARGIAVDEAKQLLRRDPRSQPQYECFVILTALELASTEISSQQQKLTKQLVDAEYQRELVPQGDDLDKIIRYEGAIERSLQRAIERLERLQQRRSGESRLPPPGSRLT